MKQQNLPKHYRVYDQHTYNGIEICLETWYAFKETLEGYWIVSEYAYNYYQDCKEIKWLKETKQVRWVNKTSRRRYCYPTLDEALQSFKIRKQRQNDILKLQLEKSTMVVENLDNICEQSLDSLMKWYKIGKLHSNCCFNFD